MSGLVLERFAWWNRATGAGSGSRECSTAKAALRSPLELAGRLQFNGALAAGPIAPMPDSPLHFATPPEWLNTVLSDFDSFLQDHAAAEKKASGMAISMLSHYPDRIELVAAMADLAVEELTHYREVVKWIHRRGLQTCADTKDPYVTEFRDAIRQGRDAERFALVAQGLEEPAISRFYASIARSEERHYTLFLELAGKYFDETSIAQRWNELLAIEAEIVRRLPLRAALH